MSDDETPQERRLRLLQAQARLKEERQQVTTMRLLWVITALVALLTLILLRRYGFF